MRELNDLLISCFSASELRRFVSFLPEGSRLATRLPERGVSLAGLVGEVVEILDRERVLDVAFFDALVKERPRREGEIRGVQRGVLAQIAASRTDRTVPTPARDAEAMTAAPASPNASVFLSYVRLKDLHNEITEFRERLAQELGLRLDGRAEDIFLDTQSVTAGQPWAEVIDAAVARASALVVLMSPAYLKREWCRREFLHFSARMAEQGKRDRVFPVLWLPTEAPGDEVFDGVRAHAWVDWTSLRFDNWDSPDKRRAISTLADAVARAVREDRPG